VFKRPEEQGTLSEIKLDEYLDTWLEGILVDRKAQGFSEGTLHFYRVKLKKFSTLICPPKTDPEIVIV
jgi:hypothetical protein